MDVTVHIPDSIAPHLIDDGGDLARKVLESIALEALRAGRITELELMKMLGWPVGQIERCEGCTRNSSTRH